LGEPLQVVLVGVGLRPKVKERLAVVAQLAGDPHQAVFPVE
jgi:hypothetical protein